MTAPAQVLADLEAGAHAMPQRVEKLRRAVPSDDKLFAFSFRERPVFRIRYDRHVRDWDRFMRRQVWLAYWQRPEFQRAYDARIEQRRQPEIVGRDASLVEQR